MSYSSYYIGEGSDHQWVLSGSPDDGSPDVTIGAYSTAAEALDVAGVPLYPAPAGTPVMAILEPLSSFVTSLAVDPLAPFDWESLPPQPIGVSFAECSREEMIRAMRGNFDGLKVVATRSQNGAFSYQNGAGVVFTGASSTQTDATRLTRLLTSRRNRQKPLAIQSGLGGSTSLLPYDGILLPLREAQGDNVYQLSYITEIATDSHGNSTTSQIGGVAGAVVQLKFYRGTNDKSVHLSLFITAVGLDLWVYAPVTVDGGALDFHDVYGIPRKPADNTESLQPSVTLTEISGAGPTILGVATQLYGWSVTTTYTADPTNPFDASGEYVEAPDLDVEEL